GLDAPPQPARHAATATPATVVLPARMRPMMADRAAIPATLARFVVRRGPGTGRMLAAAFAVLLACAPAAQAHERGPAGPLHTFSELTEAASRPVWVEQLERRRLAE